MTKTLLGPLNRLPYNCHKMNEHNSIHTTTHIAEYIDVKNVQKKIKNVKKRKKRNKNKNV